MREKWATWMGILGNGCLFIAKIIVGMLYNSIAVISDALNSLTDIIASLIVHLGVKVSYKEADKGHQFGHERAQPIAALIVASFTGIVGFEVILASVNRIIEGGEIESGFLPAYVMVGVMVTKLIMYLYTRKVINETDSTALRASAVDHRNDVIISGSVLIGIVFSNLGYPILDPIVGIVIGVWIIKSGYDVAVENMKFLMGEAPSEDLFEKIEKKAKSVRGVLGLNDVRAHYVGTHIESEVHIYVDKKMDVGKAHSIGNEVRKKLEDIRGISRVFVHIDPFLGEFRRERKF